MNTKIENNYLNKQSRKKKFISLKENFMQISLISKKPTTSLFRNFCQIKHSAEKLNKNCFRFRHTMCIISALELKKKG